MSTATSEIRILDSKLAAERNYWLERLEDLVARPVASLRTRRVEGVSEKTDKEWEQFEYMIDAAVSAAVVKVTSGSPFLQYTMWLAGLKVCLHRRTGVRHVAVGSPPLAPESSNTLVMVDEIREEESFRELVLRMRKKLLEGYERQGYPYRRLLKDLRGSEELFDVVLELEGLHAELAETGAGVRLRLQRAGEDGLVLAVAYDREGYSRTGIERFIRQWEEVMRQVVAAPEQRFSEMELIGPEELLQLLVKWNRTASEYPRESCVHELFEEQVRLRAAATAIEMGDEKVSYEELNRRANQLAHYLRARGVGADVPVGVMMNRSIELLVGLLGILKAGGAYVPLDPDYPQERLAFMLADVQMPLLLIKEQWLELVPPTEAATICMDRDWPEIARESEENPESRTSAENLAYVMYTSGSMGQPKGVSVVHRSIVRLVKETNFVDLNPSEVFLQFAPVSFDASTLEIWGSLLNGSRLVVMPSGPTSLEELGRAIEDHSITTMWLTAGLFHAMVDKQLTSLKSVKQLLAGGDALSVAHVQKFLAEENGGTLINGYGPTENTTFTCCHRMSSPLPSYENTVPIGRPIANTTAYVLNEEMQPVIVGALGELYTGGDGLARGYVNHPEATAEKFVPNPFSEEPGARLYKTGDFVRYLEDGRIEFVGRRDEQVKVRGFRVELGEIQAALEQIEYVLEAVVVVDKDAQGNQRLVAYVVADEDESELAAKLREYLREKLPEYMVPSAFVTLSEFPLTPNGKVDRRALPAPEFLQSGSKRVAPRTPVEELLVEIWADVLGVEQPGIEDDFFELGGHSLLAAQIVSRIRQAFEIELPLRTFFEASTPAGLAAVVEAELSAGTALDIPPVKAVERDGVLPLSFAQQRLWFLDQLEPGSSAYNIPAAVRLKGSLDVKALERSLKEVVRRHEVLRTNFTMVDGQPVQVIGEAEEFSLPVLELAATLSEEEREAEVQRLAQVEAAQPFDLGTGPLLRATLLRLSADEHVALLTMHHIVSDGWSIGILIRELAALYEAFTQDQPSPLPELPIQYADYAVWQREWLSGEVLEKQLGYWREQLAGAPAQLELPTDHARPAVQSVAGAFESFRVSRELSEQLRKLSRSEGATLFMTLLAAFKLLLYRYTGQTDLVVGTPVANRRQVETEGLIGFFVNTLALRTKISGAESFRELLDQVKDVALAGYAHQDVPFERLVEALQPQRDMSRSPIFQVMFDLDNTPQENLKLSGLTLGPIQGEQDTAKFDLTLDLRERDGVLTGRFGYNLDLFERPTIVRMIGHFQKLLESLVADKFERISLLSMISEDERRQQLVEWNQTHADYDLSRCIHQLIEQQATHTPDSIAVVFEDQRMPYRELNQRANQLAHALIESGIGKGSTVPVLMERSIELVIALLAINKAGAAFAPLDVAWPSERIKTVLDQLNSPVLLVNKETPCEQEKLNCELVVVDAQSTGVAQPNPDPQIDPADPMYVMFTSGSTGTPKGVVLPHRGIMNRFLWMNDYFGSDSAVSVVQTTGHVFDSAVWQFFWPLINGGKTIVPSNRRELTAEYLTELIAEHKVSTVDFVPSIFNLIAPQVIADSDLKAKLSSLRTVIVGGEEITPATTYEFLSHFRELHIANLYGATETSIGCVCHSVTGLEGSKIPVGRPIANVSTLILDEEMNPVPVGVTGEVYLSGVCLGLGYLNDEQRTAAAFIANPFPEINWDRLYKTGDLGRYLPDGNIVPVGRADHQVKIRGMRIELGEIEATLQRHTAVRQAVVLAHEDEPGDKRLVAYVVSHDADVSSRDLQQFLVKMLPRYMVPAAVVILDELPLTPSGKVDRRALPIPAQCEFTSEEIIGELPIRERLTPVEEVLHAIWSELLPCKVLSIHDDFFELGGHSLLAVQVISRVRKVFKVEMTVRSLFIAPTIRTFAKSIEGAMQAGEAQELLPVSPLPRMAALPLSSAQQRLWFLDQLEPGSAAYNIPSAVRLKGQLDVKALEHSLKEIVRRHEVLRTTFTVIDGQPVQVNGETEEFTLPVLELGAGLSAEERDAEVQRLAQVDAALPFDLGTGPLLRATLLRLSAEEHVALLTMHHIVSDGWSTGILVRELAALYEAFMHGQPSPLPELPIQYADYAVWQRQWLEGELLERQLDYWREQLAGAPAQLELPTDHARPAVQSFAGAFESFRVSRELSEQLRQLSRSEGATLFMTLLAAFKLLLYRYTGQTDLVVGTPVANRGQVETEGLIGFFVNTLVLRTKLSGAESFRELLDQVREVALAAYAHQDVPFERLVEELQPERDLSRTPLFQVMFVLQNAGREVVQLPGLKLDFILSETGGAKFDLTVAMEEIEGGLQGIVEYNTTLFESATIRKMLAHFERLLEGCVTDPAQASTTLPMLTEGEEQQLLVEWNDTRTDYQQQFGLHQLIEQQVERTPHAIALIFGEERLTYRQLDARSNQLANYLCGIGVTADVPAGVLMERSVEMVVALLGILKAGGAYLPLDPQYPAERLAFMARDAKLPVVLAQNHLLEKLSDQDVRLLCLDGDWSEIARESDQSPNTPVNPDQLAYVIYTSGSTGKPKGVMVSHRGLVNYLEWCESAYRLKQAGGTVVHSPLGFDLTVTSLFTPLLVGQSMMLLDEEQGIEGLSEALLAGPPHGLVKMTPAHLKLLNQMHAESEATLPAQVLVLGGEALFWEDVRQWQDRWPETRVINEYGPTETVVGCCAYEAERTVTGERAVPIGRPIANTQIYVLGSLGELVPVGAIGELFIAGTGLARGYLNRSELTAEKFIPNPFSEQAGARMYRTGDLARYLPDGNIEYLGRMDQQVKVRGFRIELGEIEAVLAEYKEVREAVAVIREDVADDRRLVAYVVANGTGGELNNDDLRSWLRGKLPEYMVPSAFVQLSELPCTPNGKVDRRALPAPDVVRHESDYRPPETELEQLLAGIWEEVLRVERVGIFDNFFDLGGHSLLLVQVQRKLQDALDREVSLMELFQYPRIESLAKHLSEQQSELRAAQKGHERARSRRELMARRKKSIPRVETTERSLFVTPKITTFAKLVEAGMLAGEAQELPSVSPVPRMTALPLSFAQQRLWFLDQLESGSAAYNLPSAVRLTGPLSAEALERSLKEIVRRHEVLRTTFTVVDGQPVQVIGEAEKFTLPVLELAATFSAEEREAEVQRLAQVEASLPFDLGIGPLLRATLLRLSAEEHVALLTMHHIVSDGWSTGILVRELAALYEAFTQDQPSPLAELPIQYADYAVWQRQWLSGEVLEKQLDYWREQLAGAPAQLELPTDHARPAVQSFAGAFERFRVSRELSEQLRRLSRSEGATLFMTLLAAFKLLLYRYTGQTDLVVGTPVANRNRHETEGLIGFFVNTLVLRTKMSGAENFRELLDQVKDVALAAYAHQDVPFERLVEELQPERDLSRTPLFQVMFVLQNAGREVVQLPGLKLDFILSETGGAKFDLTVAMEEIEGGLQGIVEYNTTLFESATIRKMLAHFERLLEGCVTDPAQASTTLPMLTEGEEQQLLVEWNDTRTDYQQQFGLHQLIEQQVERTPHAIALIFGEERLTYRQLDARSNQLANYLCGIGVTADVPAGVLMERSVEMVVALLGILKAGGAYLPLDPQYPAERLAFMARDAKMSVVLAQHHLLEKLSDEEVRLLCLDTDWSEIARESEQSPNISVNPDQLAYVIYTSGSTGKPKGVMVSHRGIVNRLLWMQEAYQLSATDRVLQKTPFSFDVSVWEFFWPLITGARLVMARPGGHLDSGYLVETIVQEQITAVHFVPPMLQIFLQQSGVSRCGSLRLVVSSGESLGVELQKQFHEVIEAQLENLYGPTEASVDVTRWSSLELDESQVVPIGRPIANTQIYVLGSRGELVPAGVKGELFIAGAGLARGYLNRSELTAEKFIPNPFSEYAGARMYRTGDLARYLPDGNIEYLGRMDQQVKVRGFRIELGEIEAVLAEYKEVREAVAVIREDVADDRRLVAYVVANGTGGELNNDDLRSWLRGKLPEYMVPSAFVQLSELPCTPNGKVDRRALPAPDVVRHESDYRPPETELEQLLAGIWEEVLRVGRVGIFDNFFDLGGHSLLLVQVQRKLQDALDREVSLMELFQYPRIESLAKHLSEQQSELRAAQKGHERARSRKELMARRKKSIPMSVPNNGKLPISPN